MKGRGDEKGRRLYEAWKTEGTCNSHATNSVANGYLLEQGSDVARDLVEQVVRGLQLRESMQRQLFRTVVPKQNNDNWGINAERERARDL